MAEIKMPSSSESQLSSFLSSVQPSYRHPDLTKRDVMALFRYYKGLTPKGEKFIFNDGRERELLHLIGTIPVPYKHQTYNIPISLTLLDTHPYHAPVAFVKPTADMQIKVSKYVDASGKIYLSYLDKWAHPNDDLLGLVQMCVIIFSEQPPLYMRPKNHPQAGLPYPVNGSPGGSDPLQQPGYPQQQGYPVQDQHPTQRQEQRPGTGETHGMEMKKRRLLANTKKIKTLEVTKNPSTRPDLELCAANHKLIVFLAKSIEEKEAALECPVCLETAKAPIFTCQQMHLVCSNCRPRLASCPVCREAYQGLPRRHRYAERDAEELEKLRVELAKLTK